MPSCSSKLSVLLENEINDSVESTSFTEKVVLRYLVGAEFRFLYGIEIIIKILLRCITTNDSANYPSGKLCQVPSDHAVDVKELTKSVLCLLLALKCEVDKVRNSLQQTYNLVVFQFFSHNVICLFIVYFHIRLSSYFVLLKHIKLNGGFQLTQFYGNLFVMEVDESNLHVNNLPNGDKLNSSSDNEKSEEVHSTVINESQIMIKSEYPPINNGIANGNSIEIRIKEEANENTESFTNGDLVNDCYTDSDKSVDLIKVSQTVNELNDGHVNEKQCNEKIVENSVIVTCKEEKLNDINHQKVKIEEKVETSDSKSNDVKSSKDKYREKDQCLNNHVSSSSSKKYDSQSRSHQSSSSSSSSSSRHKYKDSREEKHKSSSSSSSSSRSNEVSSSSRREEDKSKSDSKSKSRSCHHKPEEKCHCKSHHHSSHHHSKKSKKYQSVKTQCSADEIAFELRQNKIDPTNPYFTRVPWVPHPQLANLKYGKYIRIEADRNGGATVCHLYMDEISHLTEAQMKECAGEFIKLSYSEDENECAYHVMGIVHGAASYLPDLVDYMADHYPTLIVKTGSLASRDNHTTTMAQYRDEVYKTYSNGTFRYAPLDQLSICGVLGEEVGAYFPDFVARLEQSPFMKPVMPWSSLSVVQTDNPRESNDGPIFWVRPGEQMLPANEALKESARPKKRRNNELDNLAYIGGSRFSEARESLFQDRTKAHADQVGVDYGISNTAPTAAVGVLKAVNCGHPEHGNRATKDVVAFHAQDYNELLEILMLDLYEPPQTQCTKWIEVSKLNTLRREGIRYAHLQLHDNDVYYLPRKIIHQFQTISSVASVAWHIRYRDYFSVLGAPNLHTPTGINKGQVFYEKKNVAVYCPPVCENDLLASVTNGEPGLKTPKKIDRLKEYSPFKHSPRKMHKYQSKKQPSAVPAQSNSNVKSEPGTPTSVKNERSEPTTPTADQEKKSSSVNSSSKKRERSKSDDRSSPSDRKDDQEKKSNSVSSSSKKRERSKSDDRSSPSDRKDESRRTSEKSENSHSRRSSGEHTPSKKDGKSQERHSSHRKEVKNLDAEFSGKKEKSSREKSPKSKHESKKSSESKHSKESSKRRHEESSKSKSKHENGRGHGDSNNHKIKTDEKIEKEENGLKRKREESPSHPSPKKIREEDPEAAGVTENGKESPMITCDPEPSSETQPFPNPNGVINKEPIVVDSKTEENCENEQRLQDVSDAGENDRNETDVNNSNFTSENNQVIDFDLRQHVLYTGFISQVSPFPPPPPPPPPPPSSPPSNPPPPPSPPATEFPAKTADFSPHKDSQPNSFQDNCISAKEKSDAHVKKVKKKVVKKPNESYDLLGDIMSKMDKKK